jgi:hypothetical protein
MVDIERNRNLWRLKEEFRTSDIAHVPKFGANFDAHADAVARVVRRSRRVDA